MKYYRITKYNPQNRDISGAYTKDEWTSYSDIGKKYGGEKLTYIKYKKVENKYIAIVENLMSYYNEEYLKITKPETGDLEVDENTSQSMENAFSRFKKNTKISKKEVSSYMQLILRENSWCIFKGKAFSVHFGYDYYMFIVLKKDDNNIIQNLNEIGLFIDEVKKSMI